MKVWRLVLAAAIVVTSPGLPCYAALAQMRSISAAKEVPAAATPALSNFAPSVALPDASAAAGVPMIAAPAEAPPADAEASAAAAAEALLPPPGARDYENRSSAAAPQLAAAAAGSERGGDVSRIWTGAKAGAAFGAGDGASAKSHDAVNGTMAASFADSSARAAWTSPSRAVAAGSVADEKTRNAAAQAIELLDHQKDVFIEVDGLGRFGWKKALSDLLSRIVVVNPAGPALRYASDQDFQVSHVGFGLDHRTGSIYLDARLLDPKIYSIQEILGVLVNDLLELQAKHLAAKAGLTWDEALAERVIAAARAAAESVTPRLTEKIQAQVGALFLNIPVMDRTRAVEELKTLGFEENAIPVEFLAGDAQAQQAVLNRVAALVAKGFSPAEITPRLVAAQAALDFILESDAPERPDFLRSLIGGVQLTRLEELSSSDPTALRRVLQGAGEYVEALLAGNPSARWPSAAPHSAVIGLALRVDRGLIAGRNVDPALTEAQVEPDAARSIWSAWSDPKGASEIPALTDGMRKTAGSLEDRLRDVRKQVTSQTALLANEKRRLKSLARNHPMARQLQIALGLLNGQAARLRAERDAVPKPKTMTQREKTTRPDRRKAIAQRLRQQRAESRSRKAAIQESLDVVKAAGKQLDERLDAFEARMSSDEMALLSLGVREWFQKAQGFSVSGDYLWYSEGKELDALVLLSEQEEPQELDRGVIAEFAQKGLQVKGVLAGTRWIKSHARDWFRNETLAEHSDFGFSLWGVSPNSVADRMSGREPWRRALKDLADAEQALRTASPTPSQLARARSRVQFASSLLAVLQLDLNRDGYSPDLLAAVSLAQQADAEYARIDEGVSAGKRALQRAVLADAVAKLKTAFAAASVKGRRQALEDYLEKIFYLRHPAYRLGQLGLVGAGSAMDKPTYEFTAGQASAKVRGLIKNAKRSPRAQARMAAILDNLNKYNDRHWEDYPSEIVFGQPAVIQRDAFGRPTEITIETGKVEGPIDELVLISPAGPGRYDVFINEALFSMDPLAAKAVVRALFRHFHYLNVEGGTLSAARESVRRELDDYITNPKLTDQELIDKAVAEYEAGIRVENLEDWRKDEPAGAVKESEAMALAQAFSDFIHLKQGGVSGEVVLGWLEAADPAEARSLQAAAERMAEIFAANGIKVQFARKPASPAWMSYALLQGAYAAGFLVTPAGVQIFGHDRGTLPKSELDQLRDMQKTRVLVSRMKLPVARLKRLVRDVEWWDGYRASLLNRFRIERIRKAGVKLELDTPSSEDRTLFDSMGLLAAAFDSGDEAALAQRVRGAGGPALGAILRDDRLTLLDVDGRPVPPADLALVLTDYLLSRGDHRGPTYRTAVQSRVIDHLARRAGFSDPEEVDASAMDMDEESLVLSPRTPWNDPRSQVLLAMEIVAAKRKSLAELAREIKASVPGLSSRRLTFPYPAPFLDALWRRQGETRLPDFLARRLGKPASVRSVSHGIKISVGADDWLYLKRDTQGLQVYAEAASDADVQALVDAARAFLEETRKAWKPSGAVTGALIVGASVVGGLFGITALTLLSPAFVQSTHIFAFVSDVLIDIIDWGARLLMFWRPPAVGVVGKMASDTLGAWRVAIPAFLLLEATIYWALIRWPLWRSMYKKNLPLRPLARDLQSIPPMDARNSDMTHYYWSVAMRRDYSFGLVRQAIQRLRWQWLQVLLTVYQTKSLTLNKSYDDRMYTLRQPINSKGRILAKAFLLEPKVLLETLKDLWRMYRAPVAGMGLSLHVTPTLGVPLPEPLRGRVRAEFGWVQKNTDGDTPYVRMISGVDRWMRMKGYNATENNQAGKKVSKDQFTKLTLRKKGLFLIPQVEKNGFMVDELDDHGRTLAYQYVQDEAGRWMCVNLKMRRELSKGGFVDDTTGVPDSYIEPYAYLDINVPDNIVWEKSLTLRERLKNRLLRREAFVDPAPAPAAPLELASSVQAPPLDEDAARALLNGDLGGRVDPSARLVFDTEFAGQDGARLSKRVGRLTLGENSQLLIGGKGGVKLGDVTLAPRASLQIGASSTARCTIENGVAIDGNVRIYLEKDARLDIRTGTKIEGDLRLVVPAGSRTVISMVDGRLDVRDDLLHPKKLLAQIWDALQNGERLAGFLAEPVAERLDLAKLTSWFKRAKDRVYEEVSLPMSRTRNAKVSRIKPPKDYATPPASYDLAAQIVGQRRNRLLTAAPRYWIRRYGETERLKQLLLVGLYDYKEVQVSRQEEKAESALNRAADLGLEDDLKEQGMTAAERQRFKRRIRTADPEAWEELETDVVSDLSGGVRAQVLESRARYEEAARIEEDWRAEFDERLARLAGRLADLGGLIFWGRTAFKDATSIIVSGPYLWTDSDKRLDIVVVRSGKDGARDLDKAALVHVPLPQLQDLKIVEVGEDWLRGGSPDANRLMTGIADMGMTLEGRDLTSVGLRPDKKVPPRNRLAQAQEFMVEAQKAADAGDEELARSRFELADLHLISVAPGVVNKVERLVGKALAKHVEANYRRAEQWVHREELWSQIAGSMDRVAAEPSSGGVGGLIIGNYTEGQPWHALSAEESTAWVESLIKDGAPIDGAQGKVDAALRRAKHNKGGWWERYPERLDVGHFVKIGFGPLGRPIEVRLSARSLANAGVSAHKFIAFAIARAPEPERVIDVDRYEVVLQDVFDWDPDAQDLIFKNLAAQLAGLVEGRSLNAVREKAMDGASDLDVIAEAVTDAADGVKVVPLPALGALPWDQSGWRESVGVAEVQRVAQGLAQYIRDKVSRRAIEEDGFRVLLGGTDNPSVTRAAEVLAGNGVKSLILDQKRSGSFAAFADVLSAGSFDVALWITSHGIQLVGKDGAPLDLRESNIVGAQVAKAYYARSLPLDSARDRKLAGFVKPSQPRPEGGRE